MALCMARARILLFLIVVASITVHYFLHGQFGNYTAYVKKRDTGGAVDNAASSSPADMKSVETLYMAVLPSNGSSLQSIGTGPVPDNSVKVSSITNHSLPSTAKSKLTGKSEQEVLSTIPLMAGSHLIYKSSTVRQKKLTKSSVTSKEAPQYQSMNYHLWSDNADSIDWTPHVQMCDKLLSPALGNSRKRQFVNWKIPKVRSDESMVDLLSDCSRFRELVPFASAPASEEESDYPLAYVMVGARNAAQTVRLMRMIYQPQNAYCLTYDNKSTEEYKDAVRRLVDCVAADNLFLSPVERVIDYATISLLRSELTCLKLLLEKWERIPWKYVQLVSWNDFPLRSNVELVKIFKTFNGSQDSALYRLDPEFFTTRDTPVPPDGLTMYKGSHANTLTKEFVQFVFSNPTALRFYKWLEPVNCPEELYFPTIIHNVHLNAPGSFPGQCYHYYDHRGVLKPWVSRYEAWRWDEGKCKGKIVAYSCVFGVLDLLTLIQQPHLVVHKVYEEYQPATMFCLEHWFWKKYRMELTPFNYSFYASFPSVRYHHNKDNFMC